MKENKNILLKNMFRYWLGTIVIFFLIIFNYQANGTTNIYIGYLGLLDILFGIIFFSILNIQILRNITKKIGIKYALITFFTFILFFFALMRTDEIGAVMGIKKFTPVVQQPTSEEIKHILPSPSPSPIPTNTIKTTTTNQINCTGPDGVVFKTTQKECDDFNSAWGNAPQKIEQNNNSDEGVYPCNLSYGTFNLTHEQCLYYLQLDMEYNNKKMEAQLDEIQYYQPTTYVPTTTNNTYVSNNNAELLDECRATAQSIYQSESRRISSTARANGTGGSYVEYELSKLKDTLERAVDDCKRMYQVN